MTILESLQLNRDPNSEEEQKRRQQEAEKDWHVDYTVREMGRDGLLLASAESDNQ